MLSKKYIVYSFYMFLCFYLGCGGKEIAVDVALRLDQTPTGHNSSLPPRQHTIWMAA